MLRGNRPESKRMHWIPAKAGIVDDRHYDSDLEKALGPYEHPLTGAPVPSTGILAEDTTICVGHWGGDVGLNK